MQPIRRILIANRGEIALRIIRTCRAMGISTAIVTSEVDVDSRAVRAADIAIEIGPGPALESYLDIDKVVAAALEAKADAVHPGYGFLAENPAFARACQDAGLVFIGPSPETIDAMGSKIEAKRIAVDAKIPVIPGYAGEQDDDTLLREASAIGFPVLLKASAGGGGKGMRVIRSSEGLVEGLAAARREAHAAFGDDALLVERYIEAPRHIEIQILGDHHGNVVHLGERECSIQRRHQKIIEETPSMAVDQGLRDKMGAAAVTLAKAIGYTSAGTVEFLLDSDSGDYFFLEVNARIQVEHPVTELVTGLDLVREQIRVARGETLPLEQADLRLHGAAVECRIYAEDPHNDFLPQTGRLVDWHLPADLHIRLDAGVATGQEVSVHYDPMLAKLIAWAPSRGEAIDKAAAALDALSVLGVTTNRDFLRRVLRQPAYRDGQISTRFIEEHHDALMSPEQDLDSLHNAAMAAILVAIEERRRARPVLGTLAPGFTNNPNLRQRIQYRASGAGDPLTLTYTGDLRELDVEVDGVGQRVALEVWDPPTLRFRIGRAIHSARVVTDPALGDTWVHVDGACFRLVEVPRFVTDDETESDGSCVAPMPGKVIALHAAPGDRLEAGDPVATLEAMKMEHRVTTGVAGTLERLLVKVGDQVTGGALLAVIES